MTNAMWFSILLTEIERARVAVIGLVLLQHGKGADMGAAFGGGSSGSLFGASGSANFLSRTTGILATVFFLTSLSLSYLAGVKPREQASVMDQKTQPAAPAETAPAVPSPAGQGGDSKAKEIPK